ncbi:MAG: UDP-N-acetylmuramoyl-L-alanine--D-glutamate ligase [Chloroflexi bacterium]|nr:UDP-N-acetylmuramoyl-L-alanine--D-glutamate ligase [Chloroflexota bacterium]
MTLPRPMEALASFDGQRVAVVGLGIEGQDAEMFLRREGAEVIRVDRQPERADRSPDDLSLLDEVQSLVVSQGVPYDLPLLVDAARRSVPVFGPVQIFLERCPANQVIGITGSAGKTTTTTLVHRMLEAAAVPTALGGNIGQGLLQQLPDISADTTVVAEISHTQLLRTTRSPHVAAITNITPNHLDQFSWDEYQELKYRIVEYQTSQDRVVLPLDEPLAARAMTRTPAAASWFGLSRSPCAATAFSDGEQIVRNDSLLMAVEELLIPGEHNLRNALAALAIVGDLVPDDIAADVLRSFTGVPHRLELVAEVGGVRFVNDSIATTPERTLAGLRAIPGPIVLMLGGRDKKLPLDPLLPELDRHVREVVLFGEAAPTWSRWLSEQRIHHVRLDTFASAFEQAAEAAQHGETVLMSPGGTSFDAYPNFEARGQHFRELVARRLPGRRPDNVG